MGDPSLGLGRKPATDIRNLQHPMRRLLPAATTTLPERKTWSFRGAPLDQGATGTCVAHAAAHFIRSAPMRHTRDIDPFQLYREAILLDEYPANDHEATSPPDNKGLQYGSSGTGGAKALDRRGILKEYLWAQTMREAIEWVLTRGPVMIGTNWYDSMFNPSAQGFAKITPATTVAGGHEYLLLGANQRKGIATFVNSWGPRWNHAATLCRPGFFLMDYETLERLFHEDGDAVSAIEQKRKVA
jgi:hypothetical protein